MRYIHGDLDIVKVKSIPKEASPIGKTLAEGETTGHKHMIQGNGQVLVYGEQKYLEIKETTQLIHEEHKPITIEKGLYEIKNEMETDWFTQELERTRD